MARADVSGNPEDFALIVRPDGGLHFMMEMPFSLAAAAAEGGARSAYRVTRSRSGVRVEGWSEGRTCLLEEQSPRPALFREQALYTMTSG